MAATVTKHIMDEPPSAQVTATPPSPQSLHNKLHATMADRRRLRGKQAKPLWKKSAQEQAMDEILANVMAAQDDDVEVGFVPATVKRKHVHWTHVHTSDPNHIQPGTMTRSEFWQHLAKCYEEVYPDATSPTGSILQFGLVANEQHHNAVRLADRNGHKHAATFCSDQHYWNKVAKHSLQKYGVPLNAVAHHGYITMYAYLRQPSKKKPLQEIDAEPYMSPYHPRGDALVELLAASIKSRDIIAGRADGAAVGKKRKRLNVFEEICEHGLKTVKALQAHACAEAKKGNPGLAEYCAKNESKLEDVLRGALAVMSAPAQLAQQDVSLMQKLEAAAHELPCVCGGRWASGAAGLLRRNSIFVKDFCGAVLRAIRVGAKRGSNVSCIGEGGCGKSTLLEPLELIFSCAPKPEEGSTFPLASVVGYDVILWQDYEHDEATVRFSDLLSFFMEESVGVRRPGALNKKIKNAAPTFYSGRAPMELAPSKKHSAVACVKYNSMMSERFCTFRFTTPIPFQERDMNFPVCGRCAAKWYIEGAAGSSAAEAAGPLPLLVGGVAPVSLADDLERLGALHSAGSLDADEFKAAKRQLLQL